MPAPIKVPAADPPETAYPTPAPRAAPAAVPVSSLVQPTSAVVEIPRKVKLL